MTGYDAFAHYYAQFADKAHYKKLTRYILAQLHSHGVAAGDIVADLGCGSGEVTIELAKNGYDMLAIDTSAAMLALMSQRAHSKKVTNILALQQDITQLDLYGTIKAAVCTLDTVNHLENAAEINRLFEQVSLFLEVNGLFMLDYNTRYKHENVLANNTFNFENNGVKLNWQNKLDEAQQKTYISIAVESADGPLAATAFSEKYYEDGFFEQIAKKCGFSINSRVDGETFKQVTDVSERVLLTLVKE